MKRFGDTILGALSRGAAAMVLLMLVALVGVLLVRALPSVRAFGASFLVSSEWRPNEIERPVKDATGKVVLTEDGEVKTETVPPAFGALPVIYGTAMSSVIALLFAVPLSLGAALFIVRVAPRLRIAGPVSFLVEFLASIPSIAYGIWGLFVLAPFLRDHIEPALAKFCMAVPGLGWLASENIKQADGTMVAKALPLSGRDLLCGGLILGIMILPIITAVSRDVLRTVPRGQIEGTLALGATWWQSCVAMLRYSRSGLFGAVMLGLARAAGETMAVTMVIGNNNQIVPSPFAPAQTMSSLLANEFAEAGRGVHTAALLEVALILLVMSLGFNVLAKWLVVGKGSRTAASA
jgi:phosphate transport system permease protein